MRNALTLLLLLLSTAAARSQQTKVNEPHIQTVTVRPVNGIYSQPIIELNSNSSIEIAFDELSHDYKRYSYTVEHCDASWNTSDIAPTDYIDGFSSDNTIDNYKTSVNTTVEYTHYSFTLPNEHTRFKISGNYRISVFDDSNTTVPVFTTCFRITERIASISAAISSNTDIDRNSTHQQVSFSIGVGELTVRDPYREIKAQVMQNGRTDNLRKGLSPSYISRTKLSYEHIKALIFDAGNEYRRFETTTTRRPGMRVERLEYIAPFYHSTLYTDETRSANYLYDRDQNGNFTVRDEYADDSDTEADYMFVHFAYKSEEPLKEKIYLHGGLTNNAINEQSLMRYNFHTKCYENALLLKQGSYNYQYIHTEDGMSLSTEKTEGNHHETENEYYIFVYYSPVGERYDRLIGCLQISSKDEALQSRPDL
jgi:hypothetical protein